MNESFKAACGIASWFSSPWWDWLAYGIYASLKLQVDAFPDVTNVQVQVYTTWPGMSPEEVEKQVTFPIEVQMAGLPDMVELRSVSRFGFSLITVVFADQVDLYFARQLVLERLIAAKEKLPKGSDPVLGPIATGLSEIYQYTLEEENAPPPASPGEETARLMRLRTIQDAIVRPFLKTVPGVTDINSFGGYVKQYQVQVDPDRLRKFDLSLKQVFSALAASNANAGGNVLVKGSEQALVRGLGLMQSIQDIEAVVLKEVNGTPVLVKDVATVSEGPASRWGAVLKERQTGSRGRHRLDDPGRQRPGGGGCGQGKGRPIERRRHPPQGGDAQGLL